MSLCRCYRQIQLLGVVAHCLGVFPGHAAGLLGCLGLLDQGLGIVQRLGAHAGLDLGQRRLGYGHVGLCLLDLSSEQRVVHLDDHLPFHHLVALVGVDGDDPPTKLGGDRSLVGLDEPGRDQLARIGLRCKAQTGSYVLRHALNGSPGLRAIGLYPPCSCRHSADQEEDGYTDDPSFHGSCLSL